MQTKRYAVLTSGGDAPGMNAAVRSVVRCGVARGLEMFGVRNGYTGLIEGSFVPMGARDVGGIVHLGGTVLGTTRCTALKTDDGLDKAVQQLRQHGIDGLVIIGGDGSQSGAHALSRKDVKVVGVASTIDNDLCGTDISIGATTAVDIALEAIDRLRVTATSHRRAFLLEVMGRRSGYLALMAGIAGGAESIVMPEVDTPPETVAKELCEASERGKSHAIVVVAEGAGFNADALAQYFKAHQARLGFELRVSRLGHVQRGGSPGGFDRFLATRLGATAIASLDAGRHGVLVGLIDGQVHCTALSEVAGQAKPLEPDWLELAKVLVA